MDYHLETLGDERFQKLCQALLVAEQPGVQCLPVGQPDGGRDAFRMTTSESQKGFAVFQVKYSRDPTSRKERDAVASLITSEKRKVERLIARGATAYFLMTNISGTSHLDAGSIDKVNKQLSAAFGIPCYCWWRDDIERRIDASDTLKWSFPEILRATDLLQALLNGTSDSEAVRRGDAVRSYMAYQARYDAQLKFKQVDIQRDIIDLFVDVPARLIHPPTTEGDPRGHRRWLEELEGLGFPEHLVAITGDAEELSLDTPGALQLLANENLSRRFTKIVVEGAPGQGKSTVTQYLCQVHRLALLGRTHDLGRVSTTHRPTTAKIPFRVDLRDYASWIGGRDPFSDDLQAKLPAGSSPVLESFLAAQVHRYTGAEFSVGDFTDVARRAKILIVLDGFDEVADTALRNRIVSEVSDASARISALALEAQIVVTSRPAAFVNSPGFPREEWQHLQILPLSRKVIELYAHKWLEGRAADQRERRDVLSVLTEKLDQHHIRDLARNPMQLAILLALISVQGASLPDQRTALYDKYIDIFLNRESEKSRVVRDHRPLLVQIHRFLAWTLQCEAESSGAGHISEGRLKEVLREFLENAGHGSNLVDQLFSGIVERVVALVSRVQGTFEFEVQPLREYFAARYLYDTAPYSPAGVKRTGTLPERFDAISKNFYWLNVARFYAGCYSSGELASLVDNIEDINQSADFEGIAHGFQLGFTLLADHVFNQQPKLTRKLAASLVSGEGFQLVLAQQYDRRQDSPISLPEGPAREILRETCFGIMRDCPSLDVQIAAAQIARINAPNSELKELWAELPIRSTAPAKWLQIGLQLSVVDRLSADEARDVVKEVGAAALPIILRHARPDMVAIASEFLGQAVDEMLDYGAMHLPLYERIVTGDLSYKFIAQLSALLNTYPRRQWGEELDGHSLRRVLERGPYPLFDFEAQQQTQNTGGGDKLLSASQGLDILFDQPLGDLKSSLEQWSAAIERARASLGDRWALVRIAALAVELVDPSVVADADLGDTRVDICTRAAAARFNANNTTWWSRQLGGVALHDRLVAKFSLLTLFRWASVGTIVLLLTELQGLCEAMDNEDWTSVLFALEDSPIGNNQRQADGISATDQASLPANVEPRVARLLMTKLRPSAQYKIYKRYLDDYCGDDLSIHRAIMRLTAERAKSKPADWAEALSKTKIGYERGSLYAPPADRKAKPFMPAEVAVDICKNSRLYPLRLVAAAESILAARVGASAIPVSRIAAEEDWFLES